MARRRQPEATQSSRPVQTGTFPEDEPDPRLYVDPSVPDDAKADPQTMFALARERGCLIETQASLRARRASRS